MCEFLVVYHFPNTCNLTPLSGLQQQDQEVCRGFRGIPKGPDPEQWEKHQRRLRGKFPSPIVQSIAPIYKNDYQTFDKTVKYIKEMFLADKEYIDAAPIASQPDMLSTIPLDQAMDEAGWWGLDMAFKSQQ